MAETHIDFEGMARSWEQKAAEYAADPAKGYAAGYKPVQNTLVVQAVGMPAIKEPMYTPYMAWLRGIIARDKPLFAVCELEKMIGDGPGSVLIHLRMRRTR